MASLTDEDAAAYLHERGHHIYKRVRSPTVGEVLQLTREERNDHDCFAVLIIGKKNSPCPYNNDHSYSIN